MVKFLFVFFISIGISAQTVYKTPSGEKYHLSTCRMVKNVSSQLSLDKALRSGLSPCKICNPPFRPTLGIISKPKKTAGVNSQNQCLPKQKQEQDANGKPELAIIFVFSIYPNKKSEKKIPLFDSFSISISAPVNYKLQCLPKLQKCSNPLSSTSFGPCLSLCCCLIIDRLNLHFQPHLKVLYQVFFQ